MIKNKDQKKLADFLFENGFDVNLMDSSDVQLFVTNSNKNKLSDFFINYPKLKNKYAIEETKYGEVIIRKK